MNDKLRRYRGLVRAELAILLRNKVGTFYAVALAPLMVLMFSALPTAKMLAETMGPGGLTTFLVSALSIFGLLMAVYYNLTTAVVARREKLVLKRLITGEATRGEILAAIATPNMLIFIAQFLLVMLVGAVAFGMPEFTNPLLIVLALVLGIVFSIAISYVTGARTRNVEGAQLTTMPFMMLGMFASGVILPAGMLPDQVMRVLEFLPFYPVVQLLQLGMAGREADGTSLVFADTFAAAAQPTLVLAAWAALTLFVLARTMRWEPRR